MAKRNQIVANAMNEIKDLIFKMPLIHQMIGQN